VKRVLLWVLALLLVAAAGFGIGALTYSPPDPEFEDVPASVTPVATQSVSSPGP